MMHKYWNQQAEIIAGGKKITNEDLDIKFIVPFDNDDEPDISEIKIYNLSNDTINAIQKGQNIILNAGYVGDIGTIFSGTLMDMTTRWEGVDKITSMTVGDGSQQWLDKYVNKAYAEGTTAASILRDLTGMFGLELGLFQLSNNLTYAKGRVITAMLKDAIKQIVHECGSKMKISKGKINIMTPTTGIETGFLLNSDTGLLGSPESFEREEDGETVHGYTAQMLLNHRITVNSIIQVASRTANGTYRVVKGKHTDEFITEVEVRD